MGDTAVGIYSGGIREIPLSGDRENLCYLRKENTGWVWKGREGYDKRYRRWHQRSGFDWMTAETGKYGMEKSFWI